MTTQKKPRKIKLKRINLNLLRKNTSNKTEVSKPHPKNRFLIKKIVLAIMILAILGGSGGVIYIAYVISGSPTLNVSDFTASDSSKIYDADGQLVADVGLQIRENVSYDDLPQSVIDAFVSIEDSRFFEHNGFDLPRFTKAMLSNLQTLSFGQGGSTFTMQLVKGTYFETEEATAVRSGLAGVNRKIQEIYTALKTERVLSKERILELYLNRINFGVPGNKRGIQTAAQYYFGKEVGELNLTEAAMLAGVINAPNAYNPLKNLDLSQQRTATVLDLMAYHGYLTQSEADLAKSIPMENLLIGSTNTSEQSIPYQAYVDAVVDEVINLTGLDPVNVPMRIYTTMDRSTQETIEAIQNGEITSVAWPNDIIQTAIVTLNNKTGEIIAMGGGRFYNGERLLNRVTDMYRQPGSSVKTVLTYPLAFENLGWSTQHMLVDQPIKYEGIDVIIKNWDGVYRGDILVPAAIGLSLNIPAIETMTEVVNTIGVKKVVSYLNSIGYTDVTNESFDIGYAIGGSSFLASPLQMAGAHGAIVNAGNYIQPHTVTRIEFLDGTAPITPSYTSTSVISSEAAYMSTMMMEQDVSGPYGNFMQILRRDYQVYAKTGTSDWGDTGLEYGIPEGSAKDKWMMTSTSDFTTAVWVGYDKAVKDQISYLDQAQINLNLPGKINNAVLTSLYVDHPKPANVVRPSGVVDITHIVGIYPYVSPNVNTNPNLVVSGLIKSEYANLSSIANPNLYNPTSFTGTVTNTGTTKTFNFKLNDYPDLNALNMAPGTKDFSLTVADQTVTATGQRLFDYSWIYGPVRYKMKLSVDGVIVQELQSASSAFTSTLTVSDTAVVQGCGFYGFEYADVNSTEICQVFKMADLYLTVPDFTNKTLTEFQSFMTTNGLSYTSTQVLVPIANANLNGLIASVTSNAGTTSLDKTKLASYTFSAVVNMTNTKPVITLASASSNVSNPYNVTKNSVNNVIVLTATDTNGQTLTYSIVGAPTGSATLVGSEIRYTPTLDYVGLDSLTITAFDGLDYSDVYTINLSVN